MEYFIFPVIILRLSVRLFFWMGSANIESVLLTAKKNIFAVIKYWWSGIAIWMQKDNTAIEGFT